VTRLVRAEFAKLRTTRFVWWLMLGYLGLIAVNVIALVLLAGREGVPDLTDPSGLRGVFSQLAGASVMALVTGVILLTTEYRNKTMATTFLATPRRGRVVTAKLIVGFCIGLLYGLAGAALTLVLAAPLLAAKNISVDWGGDPTQILIGGVVVTTLYCVLGVGLGALLRSQVAAVLVAVLGTLLVDQTLANFLPEVGRYTPAGTAAALTLGEPARGVAYLQPWLAGVVLLAYALLTALLGTWTAVRRDVS
jgi:ABC-2 type transport system permease protein